ncbi:vacuolar protein sorting-associated protein vps13 [Chrysochromulina tobinii]|uniref:Vacuolar protein sorting-associated protein vps13 n=1 Tax=Chrysochromulina tobinii TaxID=1460289 RepID=A0A0M0JPJ9_9EUKA|nr:vacuolar protein sorting-associated protein vps13 [Chrysochromulina tobinii]|eukprot:KOO28183.1 vacuolar protein sorting-associated protein vps13 [Chrysochromulina sp. CCMP291]
MFESLVLSLLERLLGDYVVDLDRKSLKVAVWDGKVALSNLRLRPEACHALGLPVNIKMGCIRTVTVTIPWSKLGYEPVIVSLDGVYLVAGPLAESDWDEAAQKEWAWGRKAGRLMRLTQAAELTSMQQAAAAAEGRSVDHKSPSKRGSQDTVSMLAKVLNNLQVSITNIHVRYEDRTQSTHPFAIGVTLAELSTGWWLPTAGVAASWHAPGLVYVISPMSMGANVAIRPEQSAQQQGLPRTLVKVSLSAVSLALCEQQLRDATRLAEYVVSAANANAELDVAVGFRPGRRLTGLPSTAHGRWRYALDCVTHERQRQRGWRLHEPGFFERRRTARLRYTELWKRTQGKPWMAELDEAERAELAHLERELLAVEDIVQFRALAKVRIMAEEVAHREAAESTPKPRKTWYEWATGGSSASGAAEEVPFAINFAEGAIELSNDQRATLAALLSGGAEAAIAAADPLPTSAIAVLMISGAVLDSRRAGRLDEVSLTLLSDASAGEAIARLTLANFEAGLDARVAGLRVQGSLRAIEMIDCQAPEGSIGRALLRPAPGGQSAELHAEPADPDPQWRFRVVQRPPDRAEQWEISLTNTSPLEVVHNAPLLRRIGRFFAIVNETERAELAALVSNALRDATQALRELTTEALAAVLARHTTTAISLRLAAPRIILPEDLSNPSTPLLILDMGAITVSSATVAPTTTTAEGEGSALALAGNAGAEAGGTLPQDALYDRYAVDLSSIQVLMAPADVAWRIEWEQLQRKLHIVYQFGLQLELCSCILPAGSHALEQFLVNGKLADSGSPSINVRLSARQLRTLTTILRRSALGAEPPLPQPHSPQPHSPERFTPVRAPPSTPPHTGMSTMTMAAMPPPSAASPSPADAPPSIKAQFAVHHVMLMLLHEAPNGGGEHELVMVRTSSIALELAQTAEGQAARFSVGKLVVEDRMTQAPPPATRLLDSHPAALADGLRASAAHTEGDEARKLVHLEYLVTPGKTNELRLRFSRLHAEWNPDTIAAVLAFIRVPEEDRPMEDSLVDMESSTPEQLPVAASAARSELHMVAELESFSVSLNAERTGEKLALLAMKELGVTVRLPPEGGMEISGQLGNLTAQDMLTVPSAPYEMLGLRESAGGSLLTFEYNSPSEEARALARAAGKYDSSAKVRMSSVHVAFWYPAVMRTVHYLMSGVLGALMSATANTVAQMARSVLDAEVSAMALDVEVGSPLVLLPTHAGGSVGLLADLGRIAVRNTLVHVRRSTELFGGAGEVTREATLDKIHITLEQMKVDSVGSISSDGGTAAVAAQMLRDLSFDVTLERGLGLSADLPLSVRAHGGEIACDVSKQQYQRLMEVLMSNLASRGDSLASSESGAEDATPAAAAAAPSADSNSRAARRASTVAGSSGATPELSISATVQLAGASVRLADAGGPLLLAAMHGFAVEYKHYASSDLEVRLCCQTVELTSTRASATHGIERLLWGGGGTMSTGTRGGPAPPQLNVVYSTEEEGDARTLVANLHSTKANLIYDAFLSAAAFFVTDAEGPRGGAANSMTPSPMALRGKLPDVSASSDDGGFLTGLVQADGHRLAEGAPVQRGRLVVLLSLDAAEVMLPRQPHVRDSDGIVLSGAFIVKYRIEPATSMTFIDLEILQLHCYVCGRGGIGSAQAGTVLAPADLSLKMSRGISYDGGIKMEGSLIATQELEVYISYQDCKLAVEILHGLREASLAYTSAARTDAGAESAGESSESPAEGLASLMLAEGGAKPPLYKYASETSMRGPPGGSRSVPLSASSSSEAHAQLSTAIQVEGIRIVLLNDFNGRSVPLVSTSLQPVQVLGSGRPSCFVVECEMGVKVELYNASMCLWEPLVEEFHFHVTAEIKEGAMPFTDVSLNATQPCNVNLSPSMSSLISSTLLTLADDVAGKQALSLAEGEGEAFSPYSIVNRTGVALRYGRARAGSPAATLQPGATEPFNFWPEATRQRLCAPSGPPSCAIALVIDGWSAAEEVSIDFEGRRVLELFPVAPPTGQSLVVRGAGLGVCNGLYRYEKEDAGKPVFRNEHSAFISWGDTEWTRRKGYPAGVGCWGIAYDGHHRYMARGDSPLPPETGWVVRTDPKWSEPSIAPTIDLARMAATASSSEPHPKGAALSTLPCFVKIESLQSRPDLNGCRARATAYDPDQGRYHVVVDGTGEALALRAANVRELSTIEAMGTQTMRSQRIVCDVRLVNDQKRISVLSMNQLRNQTAVALEVSIWVPDSGEPETVSLLPPGEMLPLPLRRGGESYALRLRPASGVHGWCKPTRVPDATPEPGGDGTVMVAASLPLECPAVAAEATPWHCLLHHDTYHEGHMCELTLHPPIELRNLLAGTMRFELIGSGRAEGRSLPSGDSMCTHAFARMTAISFSMQLRGYLPSEKVLVSVPSGYDEEVLCHGLALRDEHSNELHVRIVYELTHGCVHTLSLYAPYWVVNNLALPMLIRESGSPPGTHGFGGQEVDVAREIVCENQRRPTVFNDFSAAGLFGTDRHGPFSDARTNRPYASLGSVWLPPGWVWLDEAWMLEPSGWQYASNFGGGARGWTDTPSTLSLVRQRRWFRHRALVHSMDASTAARLSDEAIGKMHAQELRELIASGGLGYRDCTTTEALRARARQARDTAQQQTLGQRTASAVLAAEQAASSAALSSNLSLEPLMPPVGAGRGVQLLLPGSRWSPELQLDAVGTHGLLEIAALDRPPPAGGAQILAQHAAAAAAAGAAHGWFQLGISLSVCPGDFGRSKMLTVWPRVVLVNTLPVHAIAYKQHDDEHALGMALFPQEQAPLHFRGGSRTPSGESRLLSVNLLPAVLDRADDPTEALSRCDWTITFAIGDEGEFTVVTRSPDVETRQQRLFLSVDVQVHGAQTMVVFSLQPAALAPYRVDNLTSHALVVSQTSCAELEHPRVVDEVKPAEQAPFAWEQNVRAPTLDVHVAGACRARVCLDDLRLEGTMQLPAPVSSSAGSSSSTPMAFIPLEAPQASVLGRHVMIHGLSSRADLNGQIAICQAFDSATGRYNVSLPNGELLALRPANLTEAPPGAAEGSPTPPGERLRYRMVRDGPIKVLQVLPARDGVLPTTAAAAAGGAAGDVDDTRVRRSLALRIASIGLSLVNSEPREILYLSVQGLHLGVSASTRRSTISLAVRNLQIDNQLASAVFPVFLQPSWAAEEKASAERPPAVEVYVAYNFGSSRGQQAVGNVGFFETVSMRVQTLHTMVDTSFARTLLLYVYELYTDLMQMVERVVSAVPLGQSKDARAPKLYVHWLNVQPLRVLFSCRAVAGVSAIEALTHEAPTGTLALLVPVASLLSNVDRMPIRLNAIVLENVFAPLPRLLSSIGAKYKSQMLSQMYKGILSLEALGNPITLFGKLGTGVHDIFYEPLQGMLKGPEEFAQGVHKGGKSFQDNVLRGVGEAIHKASGAMGNSLAELTRDSQYLEKRSAGNSAVLRQGPGPSKRSVAEGALHGADTIVSGLARGVSGFFNKPLEGAKRDGLEGLVKGLGAGALGLVVMPVVSVTDAVHDAFEHNATDARQNTGVFAQRVRMPRALGFSGELSTFSRYDAEVQQQLWLVTKTGAALNRRSNLSAATLKELGNGRYAAARPCGGAGMVGSKRLVVTTKHVLSLNVGASSDGEVQLEWFERLESLAIAEESASEIILHLRDGGMRFVHCAGGSRERKAVFEMVDRALRTNDIIR